MKTFSLLEVNSHSLSYAAQQSWAPRRPESPVWVRKNQFHATAPFDQGELPSQES